MTLGDVFQFYPLSLFYLVNSNNPHLETVSSNCPGEPSWIIVCHRCPSRATKQLEQIVSAAKTSAFLMSTVTEGSGDTKSFSSFVGFVKSFLYHIT